MLSLCQFLPGPNIVNVSIVVGRRFAGPRGAFAAFAGLTLMPMVIIVALGVLYRLVGQLPHVKGAFGGVACAAAGLVLAMGMRMGQALRGSWWQVIVAAIAFIAIAIVRWPLLWVLLGIVPIAVALAWQEQTR